MAGGFYPAQSISSLQYNGQLLSAYVDPTHATLLSVGDLVVITGNSEVADNGIYLPTVDAAAAAGLITGAIVGIDFNPSNLEQPGLPAGTGGIVKIAAAFPDVLFQATISATITATQIGQNAPLLATAATQTGGLVFSNMQINTATTATTSNQIRLENLDQNGDLAAGSTIYCRINPAFSTVAGSVGV